METKRLLAILLIAFFISVIILLIFYHSLSLNFKRS